MARNLKAPYEVTRLFEEALCEYTGAPYAVALDNCSNALFLALKYWGADGFTIDVPKHTYPSVPSEIIHAGGRVSWDDSPPKISGSYRLPPTNIYDSALRFTADMYKPGTFMCLSFTGPYKHLKLGKAGAILTDNKEAYKWFKKARFSGRSECSYHDDNFDENPVIGYNFYLLPEIAARGLILMNQFYNLDGTKKHNEDIELPYPDLSKFKLWQ
jgi:dTDP-4-amino-4,6-dideoxygalactose transaminase